MEENYGLMPAFCPSAKKGSACCDQLFLLPAEQFLRYKFLEEISAVGIADRYFMLMNKDGIVIERFYVMNVYRVRFTDAYKNILR